MAARVIALALLALLATGCAPVATEPVATEPDTISVDVIQGRTDRDARVIVLDVTNTGETPIQLVEARLDTPQFAEPAVWNRGTTLAPGLTVSLRARLAEPVCPVAEGAEPVVTVDFLDSAGAARTQVVAPSQSTDVLAIIERDDCIAVLAAQIADIRVSESVTWTPGAHLPAVLQLVASPTGTGALEIVEARSTILLQIVDGNGGRVSSLPVAATVGADSGDQTITLDLVPSRCDPHAIAEDKRGTIMIVAVRLDDGAEGVVYVRSSDAVKAELFEFITDYCA